MTESPTPANRPPSNLMRYLDASKRSEPAGTFDHALIVVLSRMLDSAAWDAALSEALDVAEYRPAASSSQAGLASYRHDDAKPEVDR